MNRRISHTPTEDSSQTIWIIFGGRADQPWLYPLRPGFRHCFAAIQDNTGWTVLDPLSGRLVVARLPLEPYFDLPRFYRRAGLRVTGPFTPRPSRTAPAAADLWAELRRAMSRPFGRRCTARPDPLWSLSQVAETGPEIF
jgi:hypothetical protein